MIVLERLSGGNWGSNQERRRKMRRPVLAALVAVFCLILVSSVFAQPTMKWHGSGGWGAASNYGRM
jgi:hypothetical protein